MASAPINEKWSTVRWSIDRSGYAVAKARRGSSFRYFRYSPLNLLFVDLPKTLGTDDECRELLSHIYLTPDVSIVAERIFKVVYDPKCEIDDRLGRATYKCENTIAEFLYTHNFKYHQVVDSEGNRQLDSEGNPIAGEPEPPRTIIWMLDDKDGPITTFTYFHSEDPEIHVLSTIGPKASYGTERELLDAVMRLFVDYDLDITYNGKDQWKRLLTRLDVVRSDYLAWNEYKDAYLDSSILNMSCDHLDLRYFISQAYGYFEDSEFSTAVRYLLTFYTSRNSQISLFVKICLLNDLWRQVLSTIFIHIVSEAGVAYSQVGSGIDTTSVMMRCAPQLLLYPSEDPNRENSIHIDKGVYQNVYLTLLNPLYLRALTESHDARTREIATTLQRFPYEWIVRKFYFNALLRPDPVQELLSANIFGNYHGCLFSKGPINGVRSILSYETMIVVATGNWIVRSNGEYTYVGISKATRHPFPALRSAIEMYLDLTFSGHKPENLKTFVANLNLESREKLVLILPEFEVDSSKKNSMKMVKAIRGTQKFHSPDSEDVDLQWYANEILRALRYLP